MKPFDILREALREALPAMRQEYYPPAQGYDALLHFYPRRGVFESPVHVQGTNKKVSVKVRGGGFDGGAIYTRYIPLPGNEQIVADLVVVLMENTSKRERNRIINIVNGKEG